MSQMSFEFCWLVEAFTAAGRSAGYRAADGTLLKPEQYDLAEKFPTKEAAQAVVALNQGPVNAAGAEWRAVEHGFQVIEEAACST